MSVEEVQGLTKLIAEDNVDEFSKVLNANHNLRNNFNTFHSMNPKMPLIHFAVRKKSQKVVEYLLSQDFVDKTISTSRGENIYHVICSIRGAEELFSIIERNVPHHLLLNKFNGVNAFHIALSKLNNIFIVKRVHEILQTLQVDLSSIKKEALYYAITYNDDIEVLKYVLSFDGVELRLDELYYAIAMLNIDIVVYLLNIYLCRSIPSHFHNQFHIIQFSNLHSNHKNGILQNNNNNNNKDNENYYDYYSIVEENYKKIIDFKRYGDRIWHEVCKNRNLDVVQLIFSLKGIQPELLNDNGKNVFLIVCDYNSNIKVIKYIHKLFPSFINSHGNYNGGAQNGAHLLFFNAVLKISCRLKILHYLYLNGMDIHLISHDGYRNQMNGRSIFSIINNGGIYDEDMIQYLQVISQDFDYLHNEHDHEIYRKPSFWKEIDDRKNIDEQSIGINEWKNRFDEHVLHHLSKMIQQHMLEQN